MLPKIRDKGKNVISTALCAKCGQELPYKHYTNQYGVPCVNTGIIVWNFCPICGEKIEGFKEEK